MTVQISYLAESCTALLTQKTWKTKYQRSVLVVFVLHQMIQQLLFRWQYIAANTALKTDGVDLHMLQKLIQVTKQLCTLTALKRYQV